MALAVTLFVFIFVYGSCQKERSIEEHIAEMKTENQQEFDKRMAWWREARFGLFIHWGLYAIPAGEWKEQTNHAEWILTTAQIPVDEYEKFAPQFNPVRFDAAEWVTMAKNAGMKYIVITSKHHDGFCLFDSKVTEYDVMDATPFKRDILKELAEECRKQGLKMCWYHSIMDWHHPDYLPRRGWEKRPSEGADFDRYVTSMKSQVKELVTSYGEIGVLWFDGEWESTWNRERGEDLYWFVRGLQPNIIINNRVGKGRAGMAGTYDPLTASGDFGTPEQEIPDTGLGYDWETCMTMNDHWGYNKNDNNWKSAEDLIRKLIDIVSKGGNFLLNVGPTAEGVFPQASIERLEAMGEWMDVYGDSLYGSTASLFEGLDWGRSTTKGNKIYLHVFDWPEQEGILEVPGLLSRAQTAHLLGETQGQLDVEYESGSAIIPVPRNAPNPVASVIVLEFDSFPEVVRQPVIESDGEIFLEFQEVTLSSQLENVEIHFTLDGTAPGQDSPLYDGPIRLTQTAVVKCQIFRNGQAVSGVVEKAFTQVEPRVAVEREDIESGVNYFYYHGDWDKLPDFDSLQPQSMGTMAGLALTPSSLKEYYGFKFIGYFKVPVDGVYKFYLVSDDGSRLFIGEDLVVDNDGLHGSQEAEGRIALQAGLHPFTVLFFQRTGGADFEVSLSGPGMDKQAVPPAMLFHSRELD
jgi:alpha-L-fucosidase